MVKKHGKKQRARQKSRRTGATHASAAAGTTHEHTPLPDMAVLDGLPHRAGRDLDTELAARLIAACRTGCKPCQATLARKLRTEQRPTLTALAAAVYATLPTPGFVASPTTQEWAPLARAGKTDPVAAAEALAAVEAMDDAAVSDLLEDTLDHWAVGGIDVTPNAAGGSGGTHSHLEPDTGLMEGMLPYVPGWDMGVEEHPSENRRLYSP